MFTVRIYMYSCFKISAGFSRTTELDRASPRNPTRQTLGYPAHSLAHCAKFAWLVRRDERHRRSLGPAGPRASKNANVNVNVNGNRNGNRNARGRVVRSPMHPRPARRYRFDRALSTRRNRRSSAFACRLPRPDHRPTLRDPARQHFTLPERYSPAAACRWCSPLNCTWPAPVPVDSISHKFRKRRSSGTRVGTENRENRIPGSGSRYRDRAHAVDQPRIPSSV